MAASAAFGAAFSHGFAGPHHRAAHVSHYRFHVGEVEVDQTFLDDEVGNAAHARIQDAVRHGESVRKRRLGIRDPEEILIG
jgi:hypothetical protein